MTRTECVATHKTLMEKIDSLVEKFQDLALKVEGLPGKLINEMDDRYADKKTETEVEKIKTKMENRTYEWLKFLIGTIIGAIITIAITRYLGK